MTAAKVMALIRAIRDIDPLFPRECSLTNVDLRRSEDGKRYRVTMTIEENHER